MKAELVHTTNGYTRRRFYRLSEPLTKGYTDIGKDFDIIDKIRKNDLFHYVLEDTPPLYINQCEKACEDISANGIFLICIEGPNAFQTAQKTVFGAIRYDVPGTEPGFNYHLVPQLLLCEFYKRTERLKEIDSYISTDWKYLKLLAKVNGFEWEGIVDQKKT